MPTTPYARQVDALASCQSEVPTCAAGGDSNGKLLEDSCPQCRRRFGEVFRELKTEVAWLHGRWMIYQQLSFLSRKRRSVTEFDTHADAIVAHQVQLPIVYGARYLRTLHLSGVRLQHVDIWDYVRSIEAW